MDATNAHQRAPKVETGLIGRLNREWGWLVDEPSSEDALRRWAWEHSALEGCSSLAQLADLVRGERSDVVDAIFIGLLSYATDKTDRHYDLAARVILQLMLPKVVRLARSVYVLADREEREAVAVAAMFEVIRTYPVLRRRARVPANLALDTLQVIQRRHVRAAIASHGIEFADHEALEARALPFGLSGAAEKSASEELAELLVWSVRNGVLSADDANVVVGGAGYGEGMAMARRLSTSPSALRQRRHRAIRKLATAASECEGHGPTAA